MNDWVLEKQAYRFRADHGLNTHEPIRLKSLLQKLNVITVFQELNGEFSGMAVKVTSQDATDRFMLVNSNQSLGKQHFTICHELFHLYIQPDFSSQVCKTGLFDNKADINEYYADVFASFLLLPTDGLLNNIPECELAEKKLTLKTILFIEHQYSCSRRALLYRLKKMKLIGSEEYDQFSMNIKKGALQNGYQCALYENGNQNIVLGNYGSIAKDLFDSDRISQSHYYTLLSDLGIDLTQIESAVNDDE